MKKIISILIAVAMLLSITVSAFATDTPTLTVSSATAAVGEEVVLEVSMTEASFAAFGLQILYDAEALELKKIEKGEIMDDFFAFTGSKKTGKVTAFNTEDLDVEGVLFTMKFEVLAEGAHTVELAIDSFNHDDQSTLEVIAVAGTVTTPGAEEPEVPEVPENTQIEMHLPMGATEASEYTFVAPATGTLYMVATNFLYESSWTGGEYMEDEYGQSTWVDYTIFTVNGETLEGNFYGSVEVVAGETYTFSWSHNDYSYQGYKATLNLSYDESILPVPGVGLEMLPSHLPMDSVVIPAGGEVLYTISWEFSGYVLQIFGENAYIRYESYDWWTGEINNIRIDAVDGVVEYVYDDHYVGDFYIGNAGAEDTTFAMDYYAPMGGENNPYIVENLEDVQATVPAGGANYVYFQWTSDKLGTITVEPGLFDIYFFNDTKEESGEWDSSWTYYSVYVEPGDVLKIGVGGYLEEDADFVLEYTFEEGYRPGSEQNPLEADLMAGLELGMYEKTLFYTWTPAESMTVTLGFTLKYSWSDAVPVIVINGEAYTLGDELTVTAGEPVIFSVTAGIDSVYGTLQATKVESEEPVEPEVIYEGTMDVETTDNYGYFDLYTLTAPVSGVYTINVPAGLGVWSLESYLDWGMPEIDFYANTEGFAFTVEMTEGEEFSFYVGATTKGEWTITYTVVAAEGGEGGEGGDEPIEDNYNYTNLVIGNNNVNGADIHWIYTASDAGTLTLNAGVAMFGDVTVTVKVNDGEAQALAPMTQLVLELQAGDVVKINVFATGYQTITATWESEAEPVECEHEFVDGVCTKCGEEDPNYEPPVEEPDGSYSNPFIIEELPYTAVQNTSDDLYYKWTATEAGVLYVNNNDGVFILKNQNGTYGDYTDTGKCIAVVAGDVITINYWNGTGFTVEFVAGSGEAEPGTEANPIIIDSLNITLTKDDDEIYYAWIATESGEIVIRVAECTWSFGYSLTINGSSLYGAGAEMTLNVEAGQQVIIMIEVYASASSDGYLVLEQVVEEHFCEFVETERVEATCTEAGYVVYTCECGATYTEEIAALGHSYEAVVTNPTCTEVGFTTYTCAACGDSYVADEVAALGHTWDDGVVTVEPAEGVEGEKVFTCQVCGETKTETIPALDHVHSYEAVVTEPTCTEPGYTTYTCACGDSYVADEVAALGHTYEVTDSKAATCAEAGYITYTCACGDTYTEEIPATGEHVYEDGACTGCGAEDPNPGTGSMNVLAIALIAMMSVTAVVVTANKKSDEE